MKDGGCWLDLVRLKLVCSISTVQVNTSDEKVAYVIILNSADNQNNLAAEARLTNCLVGRWLHDE